MLTQIRGVTHCSTPVRWFWFNPVDVLMSELLAGAKIALPAAVNTVLNLLKLGQQAMYGFFMTGIVLNCILMFATPLVLKRTAWTIPIAIVGFISGLLVNAAAIIASVITIGAKIALTAQDQLNIHVNIGVRMFVFMWLAASLTSVAFVLHAAMGCFCHIRRKDMEAPIESIPSPPPIDEEKKTMFSDFRRRIKVSNS
jgi:SUR7/PalI family